MSEPQFVAGSYSAGKEHEARDAVVVRRELALGGLAALLASTCCLGPLGLVALGFPYVMPIFY